MHLHDVKYADDGARTEQRVKRGHEWRLRAILAGHLRVEPHPVQSSSRAQRQQEALRFCVDPLAAAATRVGIRPDNAADAICTTRMRIVSCRPAS